MDDSTFIHTIVFGLKLIDQINNCRRFPGTGRSIKQQMWEIILIENVLKNQGSYKLFYDEQSLEC